MLRTNKPCKTFGCPNLTRKTYCERHTLEPQDKKGYPKQARDKEHIRYYNSKEWKQVRRIALERDRFLCRHCEQKGILTRATHVDHIEEMRDNFERRSDLNNLQSLCQACHNSKTVEEKRKRADRLTPPTL